MKNLINISFIILLAALFSGCQKEDWTYKGPQYYEFSAYENNQGTISNILEKENSKIGLDSICIQIMKPANGDITVNYKIAEKIYYLTDKDKYVEEIPEGTNLNVVDTVYTTAKLGEDYQIVTEANSTFSATAMTGTVTIPKGKYFGYIQVEMLKKAGKNFYVILKDSPDTKANKPTSILNYKLAPDRVFYFQETFLSEIPDTWTLIDKDGDGYEWNYYDGAATSDSYVSGDGALTPENYLISPLITIGSSTANVKLDFDLSVGDTDYPEENYRVIISESPITLANCQQATILRDWTALNETYGDYKTESIDITAYKGKRVYIGFVHGNCTDQYYMLMRNVKVYGQ
ncbi:MAG: choice-of-anchor J domain-containing protein [Rikenellaceae bacterium]